MDNNLPFNDELRIVASPDQCPYLPDETSSLEFRIITQLEDHQYDRLLALGWRRHGLHIFRPACPNCQKCRSLRVRVDDFSPTKSQRRVLRKNQEIKIIVRAPSITEDHIKIFNRYHADMHERKGWPYKQTTPQSYFESFLRGGYPFEREFLYLSDQKLIAVGLVDITETSASSVYFFHDPEWRSASIGTFSMLREFDVLREIGVSYHYLGYWISECESMAYKNRFHPHEVLKSYVPDSQIPEWIEMSATSN